MHSIIVSGITPDIMQAAVNNPSCLERIRNSIDSMVKAEIPSTFQTNSSDNPVASEQPYRAALTSSPLPITDNDGFWQRVYRTAASVQCHKHSSTCHKGKSGRYGCRMAMPAGSWNKKTGPIQLHMQHIYGSKKEVLGSLARALKKIEPRRETISDTKVMPLPNVDTRTIIYELCRRSSDDAKVTEPPSIAISDTVADEDDSNNEEDNDDDSPGLNSNVVAYSPALTSALGCNTATYPLGNTCQAKSICFYLIKYITKDSSALTNSLSCLMEAKQTTERYPSIAADSGTSTRNAMHLIARTLNNLNSKTEISAAMAAASLLGLPSTVSSHEFFYAFIWPAVVAAKKSQKANGTTSNDDDSDENEDQSHHGDDQDEDEAMQVDTTNNSENMVTAGDITTVLQAGEESILDEAQFDVDQPATGEVAVNKEGRIIVVSQHVHYQYRGEDLRDFNLYEYAGCIKIVKKLPQNEKQSKCQQEGDNQSNDNDFTPGRKQNNSFAFACGHPFVETHEQRLRSKQFVPILAGAPPPCYPGKPSNTPVWKSAASRYAEYMLTGFVPWDLNTMAPPMRLTWKNFCRWAEQRSKPNEPIKENEFDLSNHYVENSRFGIIRNISRNLTVSFQEKKLILQWRNRYTTQWKTEASGHSARPPISDDALDVENDPDRHDQELHDFIEQLRRDHGSNIGNQQQARAELQELYNNAVLNVLSMLFDGGVEHIIPGCNQPSHSYSETFLARSEHEVDEVLRHISEVEHSEAVISSKQVTRSLKTGIPSLNTTDQQKVIDVTPLPGLNA